MVLDDAGDDDRHADNGVIRNNDRDDDGMVPEATINRVGNYHDIPCSHANNAANNVE